MSFICVFACFKNSLSDVSINCIIFLFFWHFHLFTKLLFNKILPWFTLDKFSVLLKILSNSEIRVSDKRISEMRYMLFWRGVFKLLDIARLDCVTVGDL